MQMYRCSGSETFAKPATRKWAVQSGVGLLNRGKNPNGLPKLMAVVASEDKEPELFRTGARCCCDAVCRWTRVLYYMLVSSRAC